MSLRKPLLCLSVLFAALLFVELPGSWLFDPDEARYAEIPQSMIPSGDYLTPRLNGTHYLEKPPLLYWLNVGSMKIFGETPFAARFPVRMATMGMALLLLFTLKDLVALANLWAALVFLSSLFPFVLGRTNIIDAIVSFALTLTLLSMRKLLLAPTEKPLPQLPLFAMFAGAAIGLLAKGLIGIVFPALILFAWTAAMGEWKRMFRIVFSWYALVFFVIAAPWFVLMEKAHPGFLYIFFVREHFLRYSTDVANRTGSMFYFVPIVLLGALPWTFYLVGAVRRAAPHLKRWRQYPNELFFALWFLVIFGFFSMSHSKLVPYMFPTFPAIAALIGLSLASAPPKSRWLAWTLIVWGVVLSLALVAGSVAGFIDRYALWPQIALIALVTMTGAAVGLWRSKKNTWEGPLWMAAGWAGFYIVLIFLVPVFARDYSHRELALAAARANPERIVAYRNFPHSFPLMLKKPITIVEFTEEVATDRVYSPDIFWSAEKFWAAWNSGQRIVAVFKKGERIQFERQPQKPRILAENRKLLVAANYGG